MNELVKILRVLGIITLGIAALSILGAAVNAIIPWQWITDFFSIIKHFANIADFMWDTTTLFILISLSLSILIAYWLFKGTMAVIRYFHVKS